MSCETPNGLIGRAAGRRAAPPDISVPLRLALAVVVALVFSGQPAHAKIDLIFGTYSPDKPTAMVAQLRPSLTSIARDMTEILGQQVEIKLQIVRSYEDGIAQIVAGDVDFTRLGPASYVQARRINPDLEVLAMESKRGATQFNGVICVRTDSEITELSQLQGRSFAFGNERSTLGRYFAQLTLLRANVRARDLERFEYLGRHDKVGRAVGSGLFDAGAMEETTFAKLVAKGVPIRAIATYSNSTRPWVSRAELSPSVKQALRQALLNLADPEALKALRFDGFLEGDDTEYDLTREAIEENSRFFAQLQ